MARLGTGQMEARSSGLGMEIVVQEPLGKGRLVDAGKLGLQCLAGRKNSGRAGRVCLEEDSIQQMG